MFDGIMPPGAQTKASKTRSGTQVIPTTATLATPSDGAAVGILEWRSEQAVQRILSIGFPTAGVFVGGPFPPFPFIGEANPKCGVCALGGAPFDSLAVVHLACVLEYGAGAFSQKVWFDWCEGSYNIPPCEFVRVSALPWGLGWPLNVYPANAGVSEGYLQNAHVPTVTSSSRLTAASPVTFVAPSGARAVDVSWIGTTGAAAPVLTLTGAINATRDYSTPLFSPGFSPLPTYPADVFALSTNVDADVEIKFYISL